MPKFNFKPNSSKLRSKSNIFLVALILIFLVATAVLIGLILKVGFGNESADSGMEPKDQTHNLKPMTQGEILEATLPVDDSGDKKVESMTEEALDQATLLISGSQIGNEKEVPKEDANQAIQPISEEQTEGQEGRLADRPVEDAKVRPLTEEEITKLLEL